jgi:uncharacterized cupredoxin-like copper-binding protein
MRRYRLSLPILALALLGAAIPAALQARTTTSTRTISVTAGAPKELAFKVSPKKITASPAVFRVTNKGKKKHSFKVCTKPRTTDAANSCKGVATKKLAPGASATLTVKLAQSGTYEYLSGVASEARAGMKGLLTVSLAEPTSGASGGTTTTTTTPASTGVGTTTTTPKSSSGGGTGGVVNGQATDPACAAGTAIPVGPGAGDQDDDNEGGFPSDGDGCL